MTPRQKQALELYEKLGSKRAVARELGISESSVRGLLLRKGHLDSGIEQAIERTGLSVDSARHGWRRVQDPETGNWDSVFWKSEEYRQNFMEQLREAFDSLEPAPEITPPDRTEEELCTVYPLMDVHFGMKADNEETRGGNYDIKIAAHSMRMSFAKLVSITPNSQKAILIVGGDFFHANDQTNRTPEGQHQLDVDTRHYKVLRTGVNVLSEIVDALGKRHKDVHVRVLRGNHDRESHKVLTFALEQRYRLTPHIHIDDDGYDLFMARWGACLISAHHGDKAPPERLTLLISDVCPYWSETKHRYCFTGHIHKDQARDIGPLRWESLRAFAPPDAYAAGMGYSSRRALQAITFHSRDGLVLRAIDPVSE